MSQATTWGVPQVSPATPTEYAQRDQDSFDALLTCHKGSSRPSYADNGTFWCKTIDASESEVYFYDGTSDIYIGNLDTSNHLFYPVSGGSEIEATGTEINNACNNTLTVSAEEDGTYTLTSSSGIKGTQDLGAVVSGDVFIVMVQIYNGIKGGTAGEVFHYIDLDSTATCTIVAETCEAWLSHYISNGDNVLGSLSTIVEIDSSGNLVVGYGGFSENSDTTGVAIRWQSIKIKSG